MSLLLRVLGLVCWEVYVMVIISHRNNWEDQAYIVIFPQFGALPNFSIITVCQKKPVCLLEIENYYHPTALQGDWCLIYICYFVAFQEHIKASSFHAFVFLLIFFRGVCLNAKTEFRLLFFPLKTFCKLIANVLILFSQYFLGSSRLMGREGKIS